MRHIASRIGALTLACGSLAGVGIAASSTASADGMPPFFVHAPGSYWTSKSACEPYRNAYLKKVLAAGYVYNSSAGTSYDQLQDCIPTDQGWTYMLSYQSKNPWSPDSKPLSGDIDINNPASVSSWANNATYTVWEHSYSFTDKTSCVNAYNSVLSKVKADANVVALAPGSVDQSDYSYACSLNDAKKYQYSVSYVGKSKGNEYVYDTATTQYMFGRGIISTTVALPNNVYKVTKI